MNKKAILVVSFGTTHEDTRTRTIEGIENKIRAEFPECPVYRAWTSSKIRSVLRKRDQLEIDGVEEAFERMKKDGIREVIVQPTHVINGIENDAMKDMIRKYEMDFDAVFVGNPMLTSPEDFEETVKILGELCGEIPSEEAVVFMGHGTLHYANAAYAALDYQLKNSGFTNLYMGTVESYPSIDTVKELVSVAKPKKVHLFPFMIVAGDHAKNDMAGEEEDSWKSQFEELGYQVECHLEGMGSNPKVQDIFVKHVRTVL